MMLCLQAKMPREATGYHFNLPGNRISDIEVTIIEQVYNPAEQFRKRRESMWIQDFNTKHKGLNRKT